MDDEIISLDRKQVGSLRMDNWLMPVHSIAYSL